MHVSPFLFLYNLNLTPFHYHHETSTIPNRLRLSLFFRGVSSSLQNNVVRNRMSPTRVNPNKRSRYKRNNSRKFNRETMIGIVHSVNRFGVFLKSGPMKIVYLSTRKMPNYYYVDEGEPGFLSNDMSRIEKDVVVRFVVFATRWNQRTRDIRVLASIEGESLGPVSTAGLDGFEV
ncbi:unnamed protein product [Lactuca virosa]|uniref:S1 motif domain-containing protein n=1 Tax=Lactuca virosa TaxID=75947 RepID=A0AAU9LG47_9ASTR|nr:unnamed protein product [Lactuca virosa]